MEKETKERQQVADGIDIATKERQKRIIAEERDDTMDVADDLYMALLMTAYPRFMN